MICFLDLESVKDVKLGLRRCLGEGGFGKVCKIKMPAGVFAAKIFNEKNIQQNLERIHREIKILMFCEDTHIIKYLGYCRIKRLSDAPIVIMELMETNFEQYYLTKSPTLHSTVEILMQVAEGLEYLHKCSPKIIHRDLTANNVLLNVTGLQHPMAKIADFGLSQFVQSMRTMTRLRATEHYLAPEVDSEEHRYNEKVDIFSFGHLALVSSIKQTIIVALPDPRKKVGIGADGKPVYQIRTEVDRRAKYLTDLRKELKRENDDHIHPFENLIVACLSLEYEDRPSATELIRDLPVIKERCNSFTINACDTSTTHSFPVVSSDDFKGATYLDLTQKYSHP